MWDWTAWTEDPMGCKREWSQCAALFPGIRAGCWLRAMSLGAGFLALLCHKPQTNAPGVRVLYQDWPANGKTKNKKQKPTNKQQDPPPEDQRPHLQESLKF